MKSAYELAMERLSRVAPAVKLTGKQKKEMAELDSIYAAKVAERDLFLKGQIGKAAAGGDYDAVDAIERQLAGERRALAAELEEKKEAVRLGKA